LIKHLKNSEIDINLWDECITKSFNGLVYAYSFYLDVVCADWEALVYDDYKAVMPLTGNKKYGIYYLYTPIFVQQLGVFSTIKTDVDLIFKFIKFIPKKYKFVEINLNSHNKLPDDFPNKTANSNYELDLIEEFPKLKKRFSENTSRNIKKAENFGVIISNDVELKGIINLFRNDRGKDIENLKDEHYYMFEKLYKKLERRGLTIKLGAYNEIGNLIAGAVVFYSNNKLTFIFSGNSAEGKKKSAMFLIVSTIIESFSGKNMILDFEGSNNNGLAKFYKSFGSINCEYPSIQINKLPLPIRWVK